MEKSFESFENAVRMKNIKNVNHKATCTFLSHSNQPWNFKMNKIEMHNKN